MSTKAQVCLALVTITDLARTCMESLIIVQVRYDDLSLQCNFRATKLHSSSLDKNVNLATVRIAWIKRGQPGRGGQSKCFWL